MTLKIMVLGTCASDDWHFHQSPRQRLDAALIAPHQQSAIVSVASPPTGLVPDPGTQLKQSELRELNVDFDKSFFEIMAQRVPDVLIVDLLLDSRRGVIAAGESWVTNTYILARTPMDELRKGTRLDAVRAPRKYMPLFRESARALQAFIKSKAPECKVILHQARWAEYYLDEDDQLRSYDPWQQNNYFLANLRLPALEAIFREEVSCETLCIDDLPAFADARHVWGLSAVHYQKAYYSAFTEKLRLLTGAAYL